MSETGLDYDTRRRIREFIRQNAGVRLLTAQQIVVHFRLRPGDEPDVRELMTGTVIPGPLPPPAQREVRTPPAEVLDQLLSAVAAAPTRVHANLMSCKFCRNRLLYVLDTAPYSGDSLRVIVSRLRDLPQTHDLFHQNPDAVDHGDSRPPHVRWITP